MASLSKSKTLFFPTSPRTPTKIINEIRLLIDNFSGKKWDKESQKEFAILLSKSDFFEGKIKGNYDFAARDRINRAPKSLGFVNLKKIEITPIGKRLLSEKRLNETFTRQFIKFQLPSPYHIDHEGRYNVKPYLELLRMSHELEGLTKHEIAIFGLQLINIKDYDKIKKKIIEFRDEKSKKKYTKKREFIFDTYKREIEIIYSDEISKENFKIRENKDSNIKKFISTKKSNLLDYSDAAIRYLKATGLVSFNVKKLKLEILEDKKEDVKYLLENTTREPQKFSNELAYQEYLFDDSNVSLYVDNRKLIIKKIEKLVNYLQEESIMKDEKPDLNKLNLEELKDLLEKLEFLKTNSIIKSQKISLQSYEDYEDIMKTYDGILEGDMADPSLILEWNTWRAMAMLNDGDIIGNFKIDTDGSPLFTAPSKVPDAEGHYRDFSITIEVTLSRGQKQYDMEGEPVARHLGNFKRKHNKETYCLFVAPNISEGTLSHFYALHNMNISYYGGKSHIIPMNIEMFKTMLNHAKNIKGVNSDQIRNYFKFLAEQTKELEDENIWFEKIRETTKDWTNLPTP